MAARTDDAAARRIAEKLAWLGVVFDPAANAAGKIAHFSAGKPGCRPWVPTDEELMIAQHTLAFLPKHTAKSGMLLGMQQQ